MWQKYHASKNINKWISPPPKKKNWYVGIIIMFVFYMLREIFKKPRKVNKCLKNFTAFSQSFALLFNILAIN